MKGGMLARLAANLGNNPKFREWIRVSSADEAADFIRTQCQVNSRAELDHNRAAGRRFHELRRGWLNYQEATK